MASKPKFTNGTGSAAKSKNAARWLARLGMYRAKRALTFENAEELKKALNTLWNPADELYCMPRAPAGALTMIVPAEAVPMFRARRFRFSEHPVMPAVRGSGGKSNVA